MPNNVATVVPNTTVIPMVMREEAPAPDEAIKGREPNTKAEEVMIMGRIRIFAASITAETESIPRVSTLTFAYSIINTAFLAANPMTAKMPI